MRSKPLADDAECPFVRNIFVIFSRITLSFKKNVLPLFTSYLRAIRVQAETNGWRFRYDASDMWSKHNSHGIKRIGFSLSPVVLQ